MSQSVDSTLTLEEQASADLGLSELERRHIVGLLTSLEQRAEVSQRKLAQDLGLALGLVNAYIKRCVKKGLIKVRQVPSRRYVYYLTPKGFSEKSRLTAEFLSWSLVFFRRAREDCSAVMFEAKRRGWKKVALVGVGDLAEIAILSAAEQSLQVVALIDANNINPVILGVPVKADILSVRDAIDGVVIAAIENAAGHYQAALDTLGADHVLAPSLLSISLPAGVRA